MPKNLLISIKNYKNRQTLGRPLCLWRLGAPPPEPLISHPTLSILLPASIHKKHKLFFGINQITLFSCNYSGSAPDFPRTRNYAAFRMPQTTEIITIGFNFFCFVSPPPPPIHFTLAPPLSECVKKSWIAETKRILVQMGSLKVLGYIR